MTVIEVAAVAAVGLPLLAALGNGANALAGGRLYRPAATAQVAVAGTFGALAASGVVAVAMLADSGPHRVLLYQWLASGDLRADFAFLLDPLSVVMMLVVTSISWLVTRFSVNYMHNEGGFARYFTVVPLFVFAMLVLVMADNYLLLFLGWEGVGVCSYLLISFYRERPSSAQAGTRAFLMNRVGDAGLLMAMFLLAVHAGSLDFGDVFAQAASLPDGVVSAVGFLLLFGAVGKSAQLPLGTWLARAMEGPTPSSALIHAATMVTAGVYLIVRSAPLYAEAPTALLAVGIVGAVTALYAQIVGFVQTDVKGMLAASTVAQLGMMFVFCGLGLYTVAIFHLLVHAFYKSYLFLTAPSILHHLHGGADPTAVRRPEGTAPALSVLVLAVATILAAVPLLARVLPGPSDELERNLWVVAGLGVVAVFATTFSSHRMIRVAFAGHDDHDGKDHARRGSRGRMLGPVAVVAVLGAVGVAVGILPGGLEGTWFHRLLGAAGGAAPPEGNPLLAALFAAALVLLLVSGVYGPRYLDRFRDEQPAGTMPSLARHLYWGGLNRGYLDDVYERTFVRATTALARSLASFDRRVIDRAPSVIDAGGRPLGRTGDSWQEQFDVARRAQAAGALSLAEPPGRLDWLPAASEAPIPVGAAGRLGGPVRLRDRVVEATTAAERAFEGGASSERPGLMDGIARATTAVERVVFQGSLERGFGGLTHTIAAFTDFVESLVFQSGVERTLARTGAASQRFLLAFENRLGQPWVGAVIVGLVLLALAVSRA